MHSGGLHIPRLVVTFLIPQIKLLKVYIVLH